MKRLLLLAALIVAGCATHAQAQYYGYNYGYNPYYYAPRPVFYNADGYLRETLNNTSRFYNLGSAESYLQGGTMNARYFYGY